MAKKFEIELPDFFVYEGITYEPGTHSISDERVYNDLVAAKSRLLAQRAKAAEEEERQLSTANVTSTHSLGEGAGVSMDQIQALIEQAVDVKTATLQAEIDGYKTRIEELEALTEEDETQTVDPNAGKADDAKGDAK